MGIKVYMIALNHCSAQLAASTGTSQNAVPGIFKFRIYRCSMSRSQGAMLMRSCGSCHVGIPTGQGIFLASLAWGFGERHISWALREEHAQMWKQKWVLLSKSDVSRTNNHIWRWWFGFAKTVDEPNPFKARCWTSLENFRGRNQRWSLNLRKRAAKKAGICDSIIEHPWQTNAKLETSTAKWKKVE